MPTTRTLSREYSKQPDVVAALLVDPAFLRRHVEASGGTNIEVNVQSTGDGIAVHLAHDLEVELPDFIRRIIKPKNRISQREFWRRVDNVWNSEFEVRIGGVPSEVKGHTMLKLLAKGGCLHEASFEVKSRLPVVGGLLENFVADEIERSIRAEFERNASALAHRSADSSSVLRT